jgi:hypothetical protein
VPVPSPPARARIAPHLRPRALGLLLGEVVLGQQLEAVVGAPPRADPRQEEQLRRAGLHLADLEGLVVGFFRLVDQEADVDAGVVLDVLDVHGHLLLGRHVHESDGEEVGFHGGAHGRCHVVGEGELDVLVVADLKADGKEFVTEWTELEGRENMRARNSENRAEQRPRERLS